MAIWRSGSKAGFEVMDDFPGEDVGGGGMVGFFEAFDFEPEDVAVLPVPVRPKSNTQYVPVLYR